MLRRAGAVMAYYSEPRSEMLGFVPTNCRTALEIGCGEGAFLASIPDLKERWGIEPNEVSAGIAGGKLTKVLNGSFESVCGDLPQQHFDLVICNDVIEHMRDHDAFFDQIKPHLHRNGHIVGSIPNVRYYATMFEMLIEKYWQYRDDGVLDRTHLRFFTEKSLRRCFDRHGFRIIEFRGINRFPYERGLHDKLVYRPLARLAIASTFGYFRDIQFRQFGFRITRVD